MAPSNPNLLFLFDSLFKSIYPQAHLQQRLRGLEEEIRDVRRTIAARGLVREALLSSAGECDEAVGIMLHCKSVHDEIVRCSRAGREALIEDQIVMHREQLFMMREEVLVLSVEAAFEVSAQLPCQYLPIRVLI